MSVPFVASLRTSRSIERGVSFYGADQATVEKAARSWLEAFGEPGDAFFVMENVTEQRAVIVCDKIARTAPVKTLKGHAFKPGKGLRCDTCNLLEGEHA